MWGGTVNSAELWLWKWAFCQRLKILKYWYTKQSINGSGHLLIFLTRDDPMQSANRKSLGENFTIWPSHAVLPFRFPPFPRIAICLFWLAHFAFLPSFLFGRSRLLSSCFLFFIGLFFLLFPPFLFFLLFFVFFQDFYFFSLFPNQLKLVSTLKTNFLIINVITV